MSRTAWALLLLAGCSGVDPDVKSPDPYERYAGVRQQVADQGVRAVPQAVALLEDPHYLVVMGALEALASLHDPEFLQHVAPKLKHPHPMVRAQACATLAALRSPGGLPLVAEALADGEIQVRRAAVKALVVFGEKPEARRALARAVADGDPGVSLLAHEGLQALTGSKEVPQKREAWEKALP